MNIAPPQRSLMSLGMHQHGFGNGSPKMESIGEISHETSCSSSSRITKNEPVKGKDVSKQRDDEPQSVSLFVSGEKVDVSNLIPDNERTQERLNRRQAKRHHHMNDLVSYPKLSDQDDDDLDLNTLLQQHQQRAAATVAASSYGHEADIVLEHPPHHAQTHHHQHHSSTSRYPPSDRRAMWHRDEFAQHSFARRQQDRGYYPYAQADSRSPQFESEPPTEEHQQQHRRRQGSRRHLGDSSYRRESSRYRIMNRSREGSFRYSVEDARGDLSSYDIGVEYPYSSQQHGQHDASSDRLYLAHQGGARYPRQGSNDQILGSRRRDRATSGRFRPCEVSCGSLAYVEDAGRSSSSNLRMSRDFDREPHQSPHKTLEVEIAPGVSERLRGAEETTRALEHGRVVASDCLCCGARSFCIDDASFLLCPICKVVSPLGHGCGGDHGGVGLGILAEQY